MGVGLLVKLARRTRPGNIPEHGERLGQLLQAQDQFTLTAADDASAIKDWLSTRGLEEDNPTRQAAVEALITVPLEAAELCQSVRIMAEPLFERGHAPTVTDGRAGIQMIRVSQEIFCTLVETNLGTATDPTLIETIEGRLEELRSCQAETAPQQA
jgi:formiminotetrahydrofolate cyclodeaminase